MNPRLDAATETLLAWVHQPSDRDANRDSVREVAADVLAAADAEQPQAGYTPEHLPALVAAITYKPGWQFRLGIDRADDGAGGLTFFVTSDTENSLDPAKRIRVRHGFLVPPASYTRDVWAAWLFDRVRDVESHEAGEFFRLDGVREFAPHHGNGEDPYRVWHVSDYATAAKSAGDD